MSNVGDKLVGWTCLAALGLLVGLSQANAAVVVVARPVIVARPAPVAARPVTPAPKAVANEPVHYTPAPVIVPVQPRRCNENDKDCKK